MEEKKTETQKKLVVKSNRLIEAKSRLSIQEQRILLAAISQINQSDENFKQRGYPISIAEFRELADLGGRSYYTEIKNLTAKLVGRSITIHEEDGILQTTWLSSAKYIDQKGFVYLNFDERLKPYLIQLKKEFTSYQLHYVMKLKSKYSTRIYELLKQYEKIGHRDFALDELKIMVTAEEGMYGNFGDFNRNVLKKAKIEINKTTDLQIDYRTIKQGRKVVGLKFFIENNKANIDATKKEIEAIKKIDPLLELVPDRFVNDHKIRDLLKTYLLKHTSEYVKWNILYVNSQDYKDYFKYLRKALQNNYGRQYQFQLFEEKEKIAQQAEKKKKEYEEREKELREGQIWEEEQRNKINSLSDVQREMLFDIAVANYAKKININKNTVDRNKYGVFMEATLILDEFLDKEIEISN